MKEDLPIIPKILPVQSFKFHNTEVFSFTFTIMCPNCTHCDEITYYPGYHEWCEPEINYCSKCGQEFDFEGILLKAKDKFNNIRIVKEKTI